MHGDFGAGHGISHGPDALMQGHDPLTQAVADKAPVPMPNGAGANGQ